MELLEAMERRHAGRRRLMRFMPWGTAYLVMGTLALSVAESFQIGHVSVAVLVAATGASALTVAIVWWVIRTVSRSIDRELREAAEARKLLSEEDGPVGK